MNRRSFISLLAGAAGAPLVLWRESIEPLISLPGRHACSFWCTLHPTGFTEASLEQMLLDLHTSGLAIMRLRIEPTQLIVSPQIERLIRTDPLVRQAAEQVLGRPIR